MKELRKPKSLDEVKDIFLEDIFVNWAEAEQEKCKTMDLKEFIWTSHHGFGTWIRNNWGLWDVKSELHRWFLEKDILFADDMSGIILHYIYSAIKGDKFTDKDFKHHHDKYAKHWETQGVLDKLRKEAKEVLLKYK